FAASKHRHSLLLATHNHASISCALSNFNSHDQISFAQLLGMSDSLTMALSQMGLSVYKYIPFGPISQVMPYLLRRAAENSNAMSIATHVVLYIYLSFKHRFSLCRLINKE